MAPYTTCPRCGKRGYSNPSAARKAMGKSGNTVRVYRCGGTFHISHREGKGTK